MIYIIAFFLGVVFGATLLAFVLWYQFQKARDREAAAGGLRAEIEKTSTLLVSRQQELDLREKQFNVLSNEKNVEYLRQMEQLKASIAKAEGDKLAFSSRLISYRNLQEENTLLKRDLQNIDVTINKLEIDRELQGKNQEVLDGRANELAQKYLNETVKAVAGAIGANNFSACKQRLVNAIRWSREIGFAISTDDELQLLADLKAEFEKEVKAEFQREEQARIKAQIREEEKLAREVEQELRRIDRERAAIQAALNRALAEEKGKHDEEIARLQAELLEMENRRRAVSQAQLTKAGNVYVISNIGSFGEDVFKIGMTRRLMPMDRIDELGSASVPFPFDVHMMIQCNNAPSLENAIHRALHKMKINKTNPRKEFFRVKIGAILEIVRKHHGDVEYIADPEALDFRQSMTMSEDDSEFIESVYDAHDEENAEANVLGG